jgi:hypothetical protein
MLGSQLRLIAIAAQFCMGTFALAGTVNSYTFTLDPSSGNIEGTPGSTIGWGYTITNDSTVDWLVTVNLASDAFSDGTPDASLFAFPLLAPLATVTVPYDPSINGGLFALTWDSTAIAGFVDDGDFTLSAEWWTGSPLAGGSFIQDTPDQTASYSATVASPGTTVPEPNSMVTLAVGLLVLLKLPKRDRQKLLVQAIPDIPLEAAPARKTPTLTRFFEQRRAGYVASEAGEIDASGRF